MNTRNITKEYRIAHWTGIIRERNESGKSIRSFCESSGIPENVYYYWQRRIRESTCQHILSDSYTQETPGQAVALSGSPAQAPSWAVCAVAETVSTPAPISGTGVLIEIGKSRVTATAETDIEHLSKVCRMLMSLC